MITKIDVIKRMKQSAYNKGYKDGYLRCYKTHDIARLTYLRSKLSDEKAHSYNEGYKLGLAVGMRKGYIDAYIKCLMKFKKYSFHEAQIYIRSITKGVDLDDVIL